MAIIRGDTLSVRELKSEINTSIKNIKRHGLTQTRNGVDYLPDAKLLLNEAERFLQTISKYEYSSCNNIYVLRLKLQSEANKLKKELIQAQNLFIHSSNLEYCAQTLKNLNEARIEALKLEIQWLEKCIQISRNQNYFDY